MLLWQNRSFLHRPVCLSSGSAAPAACTRGVCMRLAQTKDRVWQGGGCVLDVRAPCVNWEVVEVMVSWPAKAPRHVQLHIFGRGVWGCSVIRAVARLVLYTTRR